MLIVIRNCNKKKEGYSTIYWQQIMTKREGGPYICNYLSKSVILKLIKYIDDDFFVICNMCF